MLVLTRKSNESIVIDGKIKVMIVAIQGHCVKLGIDAPLSVPVNRSEVQRREDRLRKRSLLPRK